MELGFDKYGFFIDSDWLYFSANWRVIIISAVLIVAVKLWKGRK